MRGTRSESYPVDLHGRSGLSAVSTVHDGGASTLRLQPWGLLVTPDRAGLRGTGRFHGGNGDEPTGLPHYRDVSAAAPQGIGRIVRASTQAVQGGGAGEARTCSARWHQGS